MNRFVGRGVLIVLLSVALAAPARPDSWDTLGKEIATGIVVTSVAVGVATTLLILHYRSKEKTVTGCTSSAGNALTITDERDQRTYTLTGSTVGIKPGNRLTLNGKRKGGKSVFQVRKVASEFGTCRI